MPTGTDDRDEVPAGPEELVGLGGKMGFRVDDVEEPPDEAGEVPAGADEAGGLLAGIDEEPIGLAALLVGAGGRIGFGDEVPIGSAVADEAGEVPAGTDGADEADGAPAGKDGADEAEEAEEADGELAEPDMLPVGDEPPTGPYVAVMRAVDEEVTVIGQTVVETAMTMVLTGQSLMPALQL
jgi:hypothetical protein